MQQKNGDSSEKWRTSGSAETNFQSGNTRYTTGDYQGAVEAYSSSIHLNPDDATAYHNRGIAKGTLGEFHSAIEDFDTVIKLKPDYADAYVRRGTLKALRNRISEAKQDLQTALQLVEKEGHIDLKTIIEVTLRTLE